MSYEEYEAQCSTLSVRFEDVLKSFKNSSDLSVELLSVIKSNPTIPSEDCSAILGLAILKHVQAFPQHVDSLVVGIKTFIATDDVQAIVTTDEHESNSFEDVFTWQLAEFIGDRLHETQLHVPKQTVISASNPTLSVALFSASAIKNQLLYLESDPGTYAFARQGLQLPGANIEQERKEVVALGACLQLSVAGATMMGKWLSMSDSQEAVVQALKGLKERGVVTTSGGLHLLDVSDSPFFFSTIITFSRIEND